MKYSKSNPPMTCMMTQSTCYKGTKKMTVKGVLWHSTGANNPTLKRYVQPDDGAPDRAELLSKLGTNANKNDWNHIDTQAGLNAWIGKLADGSVAAVQTMPWDFTPTQRAPPWSTPPSARRHSSARRSISRILSFITTRPGAASRAT